MLGLGGDRVRESRETHVRVREEDGKKEREHKKKKNCQSFAQGGI